MKTFLVTVLAFFFLATSASAQLDWETFEEPLELEPAVFELEFELRPVIDINQPPSAVGDETAESVPSISPVLPHDHSNSDDVGPAATYRYAVTVDGIYRLPWVLPTRSNRQLAKELQESSGWTKWSATNPAAGLAVPTLLPKEKALFVINDNVDLLTIPNPGLQRDLGEQTFAALRLFATEYVLEQNLTQDSVETRTRLLRGESITSAAAQSLISNINNARVSWQKPGQRLATVLKSGSWFNTQAEAEEAFTQLKEQLSSNENNQLANPVYGYGNRALATPGLVPSTPYAGAVPYGGHRGLTTPGLVPPTSHVGVAPFDGNWGNHITGRELTLRQQVDPDGDGYCNVYHPVPAFGRRPRISVYRSGGPHAITCSHGLNYIPK